MGVGSPIINAFWMMVKGKQTEDFFMDAVDEALDGIDPITEGQRRMLITLQTIAPQYMPSHIQESPPEIASSRVKCFFGELKNLTEHKILPLEDDLEIVHLLGQQALYN
jgi:hypothetical protein